MTTKQLEELKLKFDDITTDDPEDGHCHQWSQICTSCAVNLKVEQYGLTEYGSGICGAKGCENEADHYIDF